MEESSKLVELYYYPIRGYRESIVALLEYLELPYKLQNVKDAKEWEILKNQWENQGVEFPNLPHIVYDTQHVSEQLAIMQFLIDISSIKMQGATEINQTDFFMLAGVLQDLTAEFIRITYSSKTMDILKSSYLKSTENNRGKFESIDQRLENQPWLLGSTLNTLDFLLAELIERMKTMEEDLEVELISQFQFLETFYGRFIGQARIKSYRLSDRYKKRPFNLEMAIWK